MKTRVSNVTLLFSGKIIDVQRNVKDGYTKGYVLLAPLGTEEQDSTYNEVVKSDKHLIIPFQNEYLYAAWTDDVDLEIEDVICTVPELISILGQDGEAVGSQDLRYGLHVNVIALPAHGLWKTPEALKVGGPEGFGLDVPFVAVGKQPRSPSVIDEFDRLA